MLQFKYFTTTYYAGEYESLVLDCPLFNKKLKIKKAKIEMENYCTGKFIAKEVELTNK